MGEIVVYKRDGSVRYRLDSYAKLCTVKSAEQKRELLGEDTVTIKTESATPMEFIVGDYIEVYGCRYTLNKVNEPTKTCERKFENSMVFEGVQYKLIDAQYRNADVSGHNPSAEFPIVANMPLLMQLLISNVNRVASSLGERWELGECPDTEYKDYTFSNENCLEVLQRMCKENSLEFEIEAVTPKQYKLHIRKVGRVFPATFTFGRGGSVYKLNRKNVNSGNLVTRLYVEGGNKNITSKYRNGAQRLRIAANEESYVENATAIAAFGIKEGSKVFDDIYPHRTGKVTGVVADNGLQFEDSDMFDLNAKDAEGNTLYLIDGTVAKVKFVSGNLAGYQFEVAKFDTATKTFTLNPYEDSRGLKIPDGKAYTIAEKAEYVLLDIVMPEDPYVVDAETELATRGQKEVDELCQPKVEYELELSSLELERKFGSSVGVVNIFAVGDYLPIKDPDISVDKAIRIKGFTRDCYSDPYKYKVTLSDTVEVGIMEQIIEDTNEVGRIITINDLTNVARARANWRTTQELLGMVFDGDGYFDATNIRPSSIETLMLSVGNRAGQFVLRNITIEANAAVDGVPNPNRVVFNSHSGHLVHYAIEEQDRTWPMAGNAINLTTNAAVYIYAVCPKGGGTGTFICSTTKFATEVGTVYYFPVGVISSVYNGYREVTTTYGATRITGRCINCGRIESIDKATYFDLDKSEIGGRIMFRASDGSLMDITTLEQQLNDSNTAIGELNQLISEIQAQVDGTVEYWFGEGVPTATNAPANQWATEADKEAHLGDLYTDTASGLEYRFSRTGRVGVTKTDWTYYWQNIPSTGIGNAIMLANEALDLAGNKNHVFVTANASSTPKAPYKEGDLWITLDNYKIRICTTARTGDDGVPYRPTDWKEAGYTDDTAANNALQQLTDMATDSIITPAEKVALKDEMANIKVDYSTVKAKAQLAGIPTTTFDAAYSALLAYTNTLLANMGVNSNVDKTKYTAVFTAYYTERTTLLDNVSKGYVENLEIGNGNYMGNSAFFNDTDGWSVSVDSSASQQGTLSLYADTIMGNVLRTTKPNATGWWYFGTGMESKGGNILLPNGKFANGVTYTIAFWVKASTSTSLRVGICDATSANVVAPLTEFAVSTQWKRVSYTFTANNLASANSRLYITTTNTFSYALFTKFVLVEGNKAPEWNASTQEAVAQLQANTDLLKAIRDNYTQIEGGLILSTFLKLGALQQNGQWVESAGLKAMLSSKEEIAAYFGGTYAEALAGVKEAMTVIYHNGKLKAMNAEITGTINALSGKIAGWLMDSNTLSSVNEASSGIPAIRLDGESGQIRCGEHVVLDAEGLSLMVGDSSRLKIMDTSVGEFSEYIIKQKGTISTYKYLTTQCYIPYGGATQQLNLTESGSGGSFYPKLEFTHDIGFMEAGSQIDINSLYFSLTVPQHSQDSSASTRAVIQGGFALTVQIKCNGTTVRTFTAGGVGVSANTNQILQGTGQGGSYYVAKGKAGNYSVVVAVGNLYLYCAKSGTMQSTNVQVTVNGNFARANCERTILGNDGLLSMWSTGAMLLNKNAFIAMVGQWGIRVDSTGLKYTSNGGTSWPTLKTS